MLTKIQKNEIQFIQMEKFIANSIDKKEKILYNMYHMIHFWSTYGYKTVEKLFPISKSRRCNASARYGRSLPHRENV